MCPSESLSEFCRTQSCLAGCISALLHTRYCVVWTVRFRPLPTFQEIEFILSVLRRRSLTELTAQFSLRNSLEMCLAPHPFCWQMSLIDALSPYVKWRYTVFSIVFPVELSCFHLFYLITNYWKYSHEICTCYSELIIFQRALFTLNVHFSWKTISWHVVDGFYGPLCTSTVSYTHLTLPTILRV